MTLHAFLEVGTSEQLGANERSNLWNLYEKFDNATPVEEEHLLESATVWTCAVFVLGVKQNVCLLIAVHSPHPNISSSMRLACCHSL